MRRIIKKLTPLRRDERGIQLVELAIALPVLVLLFAAAAEFGRYFQEYTTLAKGTRMAARYMATACADGTDDLTAKRLVVYGNAAGTGNPIVNQLSVDNVDIIKRDNAGAITTGFPHTVTVQIVNFQHQPLFNLGQLMGNSLSLNIDIKPSVTMRYLLTQSPLCS
ncbi:MAG TPA: TadE/TadG family type IV pilus assembly protein [Pyrinomonadaceae bacterium]|nr:TadE/TadG family type IV pilus assembly protein [Pyrinomonadaceae bacterium]